MYRADSTGNPSGFTRMDSADEPADVIGWSIAIDASNLIHAVYITRQDWDTTYSDAGCVAAAYYVTYNTTTDQWGSPEQIEALADYVEYGQGDELIGLALDTNGIPHVAYLRTDGTRRRVAYRNRVGGSWSAVATVDDQSFGANEQCWHPAIAFDDHGSIVVLWHRGTFNGTNTGRNFTRFYDTEWRTTYPLSASDIYCGIDTTSSFYVDRAGRYHVTYLSATNKYIRYAYSDDHGDNWSANNPGSGTATGDDPQVGPGAGTSVRVYAHGTDATPNITYWEGTGGAGEPAASVDGGGVLSPSS